MIKVVKWQTMERAIPGNCIKDSKPLSTKQMEGKRIHSASEGQQPSKCHTLVYACAKIANNKAVSF